MAVEPSIYHPTRRRFPKRAPQGKLTASHRGLEAAWADSGAKARLCLIARLARAGRRLPGARQLLGRPVRPGRSQIRRLLQRPRGRAGPAGAEGRRRLPGRQALYGRRPRIRPAGRRQLQRRRPGLLVRRRFPRPLHRQWRNLRHEFDLGRASDLPLPSYVRVTNLANHRSIVVRVNDRGPYVGNRVIDVSVQDRQAAGLLRRRRHQGEGRICRPRAAAKAPTTASWWRRCANRASGPPVLVASNKTLRADLFRYPAADAAVGPRAGAARPAVPAGRGRPRGAGGAPRRTVELAAAARPQPRPPSRGAAAAAEPEVSPVSAYAPVRYDGRAGFLSGRGLY